MAKRQSTINAKTRYPIIFNAFFILAVDGELLYIGQTTCGEFKSISDMQGCPSASERRSYVEKIPHENKGFV